ncbi:MAG: hypothetical protein ACRD1C_08615 [Terriglobales bacterium]
MSLPLLDSAAAQPPSGSQRAIDGARLPSSLSHAIRRCISVRLALADVLGLWTVHTHAIKAFDVTPYIHIKSAQKGCGKTRLFKVLALLAADPFRTAYATPAAFYRSIDR